VQSILSLLIRGVLGNLELVVLFGAFYLMSRLVQNRAAGQGLDSQAVTDLNTWIALGAVVGGRLAYAIPSMDNYFAHPVDLVRINGGMYFYGALVGGVVAGSWLSWRKRLSFWIMADTYGIYAPLAIALTRFGCLLQNSCYGAQAGPPLGILFPGLTQPRYPSEIYEGLLALMIFGCLLWLAQRKPANGNVFLAFLIAYSFGRAVIDLTRINLGGHFGVADLYLSIGVALAAALFFWISRRRRDKADGYGIETGHEQSKVLT